MYISFHQTFFFLLVSACSRPSHCSSEEELLKGGCAPRPRCIFRAWGGRRIFFLLEGKDGHAIQSSGPVTKLKLGMTQETDHRTEVSDLASRSQVLETQFQSSWKIEHRSFYGFSHSLSLFYYKSPANTYTFICFGWPIGRHSFVSCILSPSSE